MLAEMDAKSPKYDQEFFLRLARPADGSLAARREARRRWRKWRRDPANAGVAVTFAGVDFRMDENRCISFSALEFGDGANFSHAKFGDKARFSRAWFGSESRFNNATFGDEALFESAKFGSGARFDNAILGNEARFKFVTFEDRGRFLNATFGDNAWFLNATFGDDARFSNATFGKMAQFDGATFGNRARFLRATFGDFARFDNATFGEGARFFEATFGIMANFENVTLGTQASFRRVRFGLGVNFQGEPLATWAPRQRKRVCGHDSPGSEADEAAWGDAFDARMKDDEFGPHRFANIDFSEARILGEINFARRDFQGPANFTGARFHVPPDFDGATNLQRIDFTGARVGFAPPDQPLFKPHWTEDSTIPIRLRAFRGVAEATKNHDLERDLYIEERKAERGVYWRRCADAVEFAPTLKAARVLLGVRAHWRTFNPFELPETLGRTQFRLSHGRGRFVRPALIGWRAPARVRLRRSFYKRAAGLGLSLSRVSIHALWIAVMGGYWTLSDYGRSLIRPLVWLAVSLPLFIGLFIVDLHDQRSKTAQAAADFSTRAGLGFATPARADGDANDAWRSAKAKHLAATRQLALANTIPFVGPLSIDSDVKKFLLCGVAPDDAEALKKCVPVAPLAYQGVLIGQNVLSALLLFFFGLALRNYFKVK